ncbi:hypothetical protein [Persicitalea sp.]|uniref:hypothetical protein n=1 Tax=Persicitalea sp. TaxID=3100273 RepID=UPI003593AB81
MRVGFFIFLMSFCIVGIIANGKKFVQESETIQLQDCEPADSDESESKSSFFTDFLPGISAFNYYPRNKARFACTFLAFKNVARDRFFPPPDCSFS